MRRDATLVLCEVKTRASARFGSPFEAVTATKQRRLRTLMRGTTCLIASHRVSTVKDADMIVVLDDGRIAEQGSHAQLLARRGLYAVLHHQHLLESQLSDAS